MRHNETLEECEVAPIEIADYWKIVLVILYSSVGTASLVGNLAVALIVALRKEMRTVTNIFISSVSAADLVITGCSLWASPLSYYRQTWLLGEAMCYMVTAIQGASLIWVPFTLAAIAIDRYMLVASPFRRQMSVQTCCLIIIGIWTGGFAVLTPMLANVVYIDLPCHKFCLENWRPNDHYRLLFGVSVLVIRSGIPLTVIAWCHWQIARILDAQGAKFQRMSVGNNDLSRKQRLQTLLKAMVIIFAVSSFPLDLFNVLQDLQMVLKIRLVPDGFGQFAFFFSHWLAMSGTLLNPLVYAWWNENFRRQIQGCLAEIRGEASDKRGLYSVILSGRASQRFDEPVRTLIADKKQISDEMDECEGDVQV